MTCWYVTSLPSLACGLVHYAILGMDGSEVGQIKLVWLGSSITPQEEGVLATPEIRSSGSKVNLLTNRWPTNIRGGQQNRSSFRNQNMSNKRGIPIMCSGKRNCKQMS